VVAIKDDGIQHTSFWKTAGLCFSTPVSPHCKLPNELLQLTFRSSFLHVTTVRSVLLNFIGITARVRPLLGTATRIQTVCLSARKPAIGVEEESLIGPKHPLFIQATPESMRLARTGPSFVLDDSRARVAPALGMQKHPTLSSIA
jgi:hypothetical protein